MKKRPSVLSEILRFPRQKGYRPGRVEMILIRKEILCKTLKHPTIPISKDNFNVFHSQAAPQSERICECSVHILFLD
jgi:hypothetical protein